MPFVGDMVDTTWCHAPSVTAFGEVITCVAPLYAPNTSCPAVLT